MAIPFRTLLAGWLLCCLCGCAHRVSSAIDDLQSGVEVAAVQVVTRRIAAYNAHDIEGFLALYARDVRIYVYPDRFLGEGRERMRLIFGPQFAQGDGFVNVGSQHVLDNQVVSIEDVTIGGVEERNIAIYTVVGGLITEVRLIEPGE